MSIIKRLFVKATWCWLWVCLIIACTPESLTPTAPATISALVTASLTPAPPPQFTPTSESTSPAPATATIASAPDLVVETIIPTANPAPASRTPIPATPEPTGTPTLVPLIPPPVGLIYATKDGLWRIKEDDSTVFLLAQRYGRFSQDGSQFLFDEGNDIWLANFNDGTVRNITNTPDRNECCARWWLGQPDKIAFGSWPFDYIPFQNAFGIKDLGFLTVINWDGTDYEVLDETTTIYNWLAHLHLIRSSFITRQSIPWMVEARTWIFIRLIS